MALLQEKGVERGALEQGMGLALSGVLASCVSRIKGFDAARGEQEGEMRGKSPADETLERRGREVP